MGCANRTYNAHYIIQHMGVQTHTHTICMLPAGQASGNECPDSLNKSRVQAAEAWPNDSISNMILNRLFTGMPLDGVVGY